MSGYIAFPTTAPEAARYLTQHYRMAVSEDKVRRVFDAIGDGLRAGPRGPRLILQETLDQIMATLEREGYVFSSGILQAVQSPLQSSSSSSGSTPTMAEPCEATSVPAVSPLRKPQPVVYSQSEQTNTRGRRDRRR
jgi:hypothetical protein